jgi:hypothetical protein
LLIGVIHIRGPGEWQDAERPATIDAPLPQETGGNDDATLGTAPVLTVREARDIVDFGRFPAPEGAKPERYSSSVRATFQIGGELSAVVAQLEKSLAQRQWPVVARDESTKDRVVLYVRAGKALFVSCAARKDNDEPIRIDLAILGNVDLRTIPKTDAGEIFTENLDYVVYQTAAGLDDAIAFYDARFREAGWQR